MGYCRVTLVSLIPLLLTLIVRGRDSRREDSVDVPFGAMFDHTAISSQAAMEYKLYLVNNLIDVDGRDRRIRLQTKHIDIFLNMRDVYSTNTEFCELARQGIFALFGTHTVDTIDALTAYTSTFHMPFLSPRMPVNNTGQELGYVLFMHPYYATGVVDVIMHYAWSEIWYLHSTNEGSIRMQQIFDALADVNYVLRINVIRVAGVDEAVEMLRVIDRRRGDEDKKILLDMPLNETESLLNRQQREANSARHHYFIMELGCNEMKLKIFQHGGMNVTGFRLFDFINNRTIHEFSRQWDIHHPHTFNKAKGMLSHDAALTMDSISLLVRALAKMKGKNPGIFKQHLDRHGDMIRNNSRELDCETESPLPWKLGYDIMKTMREIDFAGFTGRVAFDKFGLRRGYTLDVLEVTTGMGLSHIGSYHPARGLYIQNPSLIRYKSVKPQENRTRKITSILTAPFLTVKPDADKYEGNDRYEGYCADLAKMIADTVDIEYEIIPVKDSKYGGRDENGTWNGMVGELIRGEVDLAIAPLTITAERERYIDFSKPFMSLGISIMIKKPEKEQPGVFSFMYPLSYEIWMCIIFAYIGVSVVLFLVSRFSPFEWHIEDNTDGPTVTNNFTIFNSLWFSLGAFMQQGCDIEPRSMSGRIVGSMWWFFTLIIVSSYTANLAAFLTVQRMHSPIESADDLAKQTEIKYGTVASGSTKEFFKTSTIPVYERMWAFMSSADNDEIFVKNNEEGVRKVRESNGRYAFLMESTANDYTNQRQTCDTMKVGNNLDSKGYGIGTPLGSDLRDKITLAVLQLREDGELSTLQTTWWYDKGECPGSMKDSKETTNALKLSNVAGIFYILLGGLTLALFMAAMEFLHKSNVEATRRKTSFINAVRSKARLSLSGKPDRAAGVGRPEIPPNMSMSTYTYQPAAQLITYDGYTDPNTHTQV